ncbi:MAG: hypothetical protein ACLFP8_07470 [Alphaproteobacteria bacterium]
MNLFEHVKHFFSSSMDSASGGDHGSCCCGGKDKSDPKTSEGECCGEEDCGCEDDNTKPGGGCCS